MILMRDVSDAPSIFGEKQILLQDVNLNLPKGRYALLSRTPQLHRALIDILAGLRPPRVGAIRHEGLISWPMGRAGFVRGKLSGLRMTEFICSLYGIDAKACVEFLSDILTNPEYLSQRMEHWPLYVRQEFTFALALVPSFDIYVIDGAIPHEPSRFTRLWQALFEERLVGRGLILSTYRQDQLTDYCNKGLLYERHGFKVDDDLDRCVERYPVRQSRAESAESAGSEAALDAFAGGADIGI